jgi:hypothetical protein
MSVFLLPRALCLEINSLMRKFWWGAKENGSKVNWMSWGRMGRSKAMGGMGFRDFNSFNKALLAKQIWRLWENPSSLVAQIMQAKYYPTSSVLEANMGRRISFAWRSILSSRELVKEGLVWRVGNGRKVRIWEDRWLPSPVFKILTTPSILNPTATVDQLIDREARWWDNNRLNLLFSAEEVSMIQKIPISCTNQEDIIIWRGTKNGIFSVRSAYHMQMEMVSRNEGACSESEKQNRIWKRIWSLSVPNSEKNFLWRACNNILPTKENLCRRKIIMDSLCMFCGMEVESGFHILWQCPSAMDVWSGGCPKFRKVPWQATISWKLWRVYLINVLRRKWSFFAVLLGVSGRDEMKFFMGGFLFTQQH